MENILLDTISLLAIFSAIITISIKNPVISVLFLISVFFNISAYLVIIGISFIGISYLIVYVGAVTVLFLFVIMIFNLQISNSQEFQFNNKSLILLISSIFLFEILHIQEIFFKNFCSIKSFNNIFIYSSEGQINITNISNLDIEQIFSNFNQIESIAIVIYTNSVICFILLSIILLIAIIGPISLNKNLHYSSRI